MSGRVVGGCGCWRRGLEKEGQVYISCAGPNSCVAGGGAWVVLSFPPPCSFPLRLGQLVTSLFFFCPSPPFNLSRRPENVECVVRTLQHKRLALRQCIVGVGTNEDEGRKGWVERVNVGGGAFSVHDVHLQLSLAAK